MTKAASDTPRAMIRAQDVRRLHALARAERWELSEADFATALERSVAHRFRDESPGPGQVQDYLDSLHLEDLALACACARGSERAWEHFVHQFRPGLLAAASAARPDTARDLADSLYGDLFGLEERGGVRRSLFDYFHGRCSLAGWLRAVLAQRAVDAARASRRFEPLADEPDAGPRTDPEPPDADRRRRLALVRTLLAAVIAELEPRDRLRLSLYYARQLKLLAIGKILGESEATASRKLERTRREIRVTIERRLRERHHFKDEQVAECFDEARTDPAFDLARVLGPPGG